MTNQPQQPEPAPTVGETLKQARERLGLSLRNLEAITGISRPTLNRLELDQVESPNPAHLQTLADALELNSSDLFALVGYRPDTTLPSLTPYLRAKYRLPPDAIAEAHEAVRRILERYDQTPAHTNWPDDTAADTDDPQH